MSRVILALPDNEQLADSLASLLNLEVGKKTIRRFPDEETYVRIDTPVSGREVILVCTLHRPDDKFLPLLFLASTARDIGATRVGLVAPLHRGPCGICWQCLYGFTGGWSSTGNHL